MGDQEGSIFRKRNGGDSCISLKWSNKEVKEEFTEEEFEQLESENDIPPRPFYRLKGDDSYDFQDNYAPPQPSMDEWSSDFSRIVSSVQLTLHRNLDELFHGMLDIHEDGGVKKRVLLKGLDNTRPEPGHRVWIHYESYKEVKTGEETEGQVILDSTSKHGLASTFLVGGDVIRGLSLGVESMNLKEVAEFIFGSDFAYGKGGIPGFIEPGARVRMIVQLEHSEANPTIAPEYMETEDCTELSLVKKLEAADKLIIAGNAKFAGGRFYDAVERYNRALTLLEDDCSEDTGSEDPIDRKMLDLTRFQVWSNLALCFLREKRYGEVIKACKSALRLHHLHPDLKPKVLYRYALAEFNLEEFDSAGRLCERGLRSMWGHREFRDLKYKIEIGKLTAENKRKLEEKQKLENEGSATRCA